MIKNGKPFGSFVSSVVIFGVFRSMNFASIKYINGEDEKSILVVTSTLYTKKPDRERKRA